MADKDEIVIDEYGFEKDKLKHKKREKTDDLKTWFDESIGYDVLDKHHF